MIKRFKSVKKHHIRINKTIIIFIMVFFLIYSFISLINTKIDSKIISKIILDNPQVSFKPNDILKYSFNYISNDRDISIPVINIVKEKEPIIYIYNTHQTEKYLSNDEKTADIYLASFMLQEKLKKYNISSIVEQNNVSEILNINNWKYSSSYKVSRMFLEQAKIDYPSLKMFVDLHRDSSKRDKTVTTINNKVYARILFIVGLDNPTYNNNLLVTEIINNKLKNINSNLSRGIYKKTGPGVNGVYNQDFDTNTILIELGGQYNYINEVSNTLDILASVLSDYIKEII